MYTLDNTKVDVETLRQLRGYVYRKDMHCIIAYDDIGEFVNTLMSSKKKYDTDVEEVIEVERLRRHHDKHYRACYSKIYTASELIFNDVIAEMRKHFGNITKLNRRLKSEVKRFKKHQLKYNTDVDTRKRLILLVNVILNDLSQLATNDKTISTFNSIIDKVFIFPTDCDDLFLHCHDYQ